MTRKKVKLSFIANDSARKATYKKRKKSLLKKVEELSTLCGIEACAIVYSPDDPLPQVWPSDNGVERVVERFRIMPELEQSKKMANQESFIGQRILKSKDQVMKLMKDNREKEMTMFMFRCLNVGRVLPDNNMTTSDLSDLSSMIEQNLRDINKRLETLSANEMTTNQPQVQTPALAVPKTKETTLVNSGYGLDMNANPVPRQMFMDLLNGNGNQAIMPHFGDADLQLQTSFWPNLLP
ncbi:agamous-like MADS-box protein AGL80 [Cajanus cajan]|uniref:Agamous-like MADS-box protein AGL80 n=1 Tax=Cajanus cajan TaxID=3821 RepID=A0A151RPQ0_CAJCA|nr:agamous-like MADS-box protein AGL80 [Cajanus cajan]KYP44524.1 Agamous-like MADS-box protein AGL80 [Cajanus cajan]